MAERHLTLAEVADQLQVMPRWLREFVGRHQIPVLRNGPAGKIIRFDRVAITALEEALRRPCRSESSDEKTRAPSRSMAPSSYRTARGGAFERVLNLTTSTSPAKKRRPSKQKSCATPGTANVVPITVSPRRSNRI
jgi:hypothetical protein